MSDKSETLTIKVRLQPGPVVRVIDDTEWSEAAGWVQSVPVGLAANLLAYPHAGWSLAERPTAAARKALADLLGVAPENIASPDEPIRFAPTLAQVAGRDRAAQLEEMGITVKALAGMSAADIQDLAFRSGATPAEIGAWVKAAQA